MAKREDYLRKKTRELSQDCSSVVGSMLGIAKIDIFYEKLGKISEVLEAADQNTVPLPLETHPPLKIARWKIAGNQRKRSADCLTNQ